MTFLVNLNVGIADKDIKQKHGPLVLAVAHPLPLRVPPRTTGDGFGCGTDTLGSASRGSGRTHPPPVGCVHLPLLSLGCFLPIRRSPARRVSAPLKCTQ